MSTAYFTALADYNLWADSKAIAWLRQINEEQWARVITSSFSSVKQTAIHIASAEKIWIDFWTASPDPVYLSAGFDGSRYDLLAIWHRASAGLKNFIETFPEEDYGKKVTFRYPRGGISQLDYGQTFAHIINHSTYHRGQLVALLRQVGFTEFSSMDLATYYLLPQIGTPKVAPGDTAEDNVLPSRAHLADDTLPSKTRSLHPVVDCIEQNVQ